MPPLPVMVAELPAQIVCEVTVMFGKAFTVTIGEFVPTQPFVVPVTVYVVVVDGETVIVFVVGPVFQL